MKTYLLFLVLFLTYQGINAQISFVKYHKLDDNLSEIRKPLELSNGNLVCVIRRGISPDPGNVCEVFLFDRCGNYIESVVLDFGPLYVDVYTAIEIEENKILCNGLSTKPNSILKSYHFVLDGTNLDLLNQVKYYRRNFIIYETKIKGDEIIHYGGLSGEKVGISKMNKQLVRNIHLVKYHDNTRNKNTMYLGELNSKMLYIQQSMGKETLLCLDDKLNPNFTVDISMNPNFSDFTSQFIPFENDTFMIGEVYYDHSNASRTYYITKYYRDSVIWSKEAFRNKNSLTGYDFWHKKNDNIIAISDSGHVAYFNKNGDLLNYYKGMNGSIDVGDLYKHTLTSDGGLFAVEYKLKYIPDENRTETYLKLIKADNEFKIDSIPHEDCTTSSKDGMLPYSVQIYPNPSSQHINIQSPKMIKAIDIFNELGMVVYHKSYVNRKNIDNIPLSGEGTYFVTVTTIDNMKITRKIIRIR